MPSTHFRKPVYAAAGYKTMFYGPGRKEFDPSKPMPPYENYLQETAKGTLSQLSSRDIDEGIIGSFMSARFLKQGNLPGFLPYMVPELQGKPCTAVEGACGTGGRAIAMAIRSILSDLSDSVFVAGFELQNSVKSVYGADILAGAAYYRGERKGGNAFFFPGIFSDRVKTYADKYAQAPLREAMAKWYENAILNARKHPKAQEYHNTNPHLLKSGMTPPNPDTFLPYLNLFDCSKISDGAASLIIASEEGLKKLGIKKEDAVEIIGLGEAEADITKGPDPDHAMSTTQIAAKKALEQAHQSITDMDHIELHDCFTISGLLALEAIGLAPFGKGADYVLNQDLSKLNKTGGLIGYGHPTGATGVRQMVDLIESKSSGLMVSMGGNDKTVTCLITRAL